MHISGEAEKSAASLDLWELPDGMDFLLRPVREGMCKYESLVDGTLTLEDILIMNVCLNNAAHNENLQLGSLTHGV